MPWDALWNPQFNAESQDASSDYGEYDPHVEWPWQDAEDMRTQRITDEAVKRQKTDVFLP